MGFGPLQRLPNHRAAAASFRLPGNPTPSRETGHPEAAPPLRFRPLQRLPARGSGMKWLSLPRPTACAFRLSQPHGAFIRPEPAGLVSCRIRSWGHPPELCSSRAAVRRFRRRSPLDVRNVFRVFLRARIRHQASAV